MLETFLTLGSASRYEPEKIKGSRFVASLAPVGSVSAAEEYVRGVRAEFSDARHHCWAWRLGPDGARWRSSDDGEPSGSAGRPILAQLEGHELTDLVCVVTRWFGGVKLGVGGLVRAYGGAAGQACDRADVRRVEVRVALRLEHAYSLSSPVQGVLAAYALEPEDADYGESVALTVRVPVGRRAAFVEELGERTAGGVRVEELA